MNIAITDVCKLLCEEKRLLENACVVTSVSPIEPHNLNLCAWTKSENSSEAGVQAMELGCKLQQIDGFEHHNPISSISRDYQD